MVKVNINTAGHQIEVQCAERDLGYVIEKALQLFDATRPAVPSAGGVEVGFQIRHGEAPASRN